MLSFRRVIAVLTISTTLAACVPLSPAPPTPPEHSALQPARLLWMDAHAENRQASVVANVDLRMASVARW